MTNYTMTPEEALAAIPADAMNPSKLAALLREVTSVAREDLDRAVAALHLEHHVDLLHKLQGLLKVAPKGTPAEFEIRAACNRQYESARRFAARNKLPFALRGWQ